MVDGIVGDLPDVAVGSERVEEAADQPVDARVGRIGAMQGIVSDREADPGHANTHDEAEGHIHSSGRVPLMMRPYDPKYRATSTPVFVTIAALACRDSRFARNSR